mmetsp:Transcript_41173/g.130442  ORF Transcript_41173/g.130442 Transcript_41173/m.130442 type:complete len:620 (+) Transcript_41173:120-1979(+)
MQLPSAWPAARATNWRLTEADPPQELREVIALVPLRAAVFPSGCACCQPIPLARTGLGFACRVTRAEWLPLSEQDWRVLCVQDPNTFAIGRPTTETTLGHGTLVVFLCAESSSAKGKPWAQADADILQAASPGDTLSKAMRLQLPGGAQAEFRVLKGATLRIKVQDDFVVDYDPMARLLHNFGKVQDFAGGMEVELLWFRDEAVAPRKRLGPNIRAMEGLDLKGRFDLTVVGIARISSTGQWEITWAPPITFEVLSGDVCVALPPIGGLPTLCSAVFSGRATLHTAAAANTAAAGLEARDVAQGCFCSNCGNAFADGAAFCGRCGARRPTEELPLSPALPPGGTGPLRPPTTSVPTGALARWQKGTLVEYFSATLGGWTPSVVQGYDESSGCYKLDIQPMALPSKIRLMGSIPATRVLPPTASTLPVPSQLSGQSVSPTYAAAPSLPPGSVSWLGSPTPDSAASWMRPQGGYVGGEISPGTRVMFASPEQTDMPTYVPSMAAQPGNSPYGGYGGSPNSPQRQDAQFYSRSSSASPSNPQGCASATGGSRFGPASPASLAPPRPSMPPVRGDDAPSYLDNEEEEMLQQLMQMGFNRQLASEALRRCSSVEAATLWLLDRA